MPKKPTENPAEKKLEFPFSQESLDKGNFAIHSSDTGLHKTLTITCLSTGKSFTFPLNDANKHLEVVVSKIQDRMARVGADAAEKRRKKTIETA